VKWNETQPEEMFTCEAKGLELLRYAHEIQVPQVIGYGHKLQKSYLVLEYINASRQQEDYWEDFGTSLAQLHRHTHP
jgi:fructosamine-3-kinase